MPTVELHFTPLAEHVRTARLVAVAVARRSGFDEDALDEVRLAVGEACGRAVRRCLAAEVHSPVEVELDDGDDGLVVTVRDRAPLDGVATDEDRLCLSLVQGLADEMDLRGVESASPEAGSELMMTWSASRRAGLA